MSAKPNGTMVISQIIFSLFLLIQVSVLSTNVVAQQLDRPPGTGEPLTVNQQDALYQQVRSVLDHSLTSNHRQHIHTPNSPRCGTRAIQEAVQHWDDFTPDTRAKLTTFFQRPSNQRSYASPGGKFLIHYDLTGFHAVDGRDDDGNGIPDYVDFTAATFDEVWRVEIDDLGYREPLDDGDGVYDIHIQQLGLQGVYGLTFPSGGITSTSYIEIDNNFTDNIFQTRGNDGVQVTAAHEFFHAIQFAYYAPFDAAWWQELTATWMEDVIYDDVNDYLQYQPFFFQSPEISLDQFQFGSFQPFAASIFGHYLQKIYGVDTIKETWESLGSRTPATYDILDIDVALPGGFASVLPRFVVWNYLTGGRHLPGYYEEGAVYGEVSPRTVSPVSGVTIGGTARIDHLASTYISIDTRGLSGGLQVTFSLESGSTYEIVMMLFRSGSPEVVSLAGGDEVTIANVSQYDEVVLVPIATSTTGRNFDIGYSVINSASIRSTSDRVGDFDHDGSVAFADFLAFAESFGKAATDIDHVRPHDLNADGTIGFADFLIFASHFGE